MIFFKLSNKVKNRGLTNNGVSTKGLKIAIKLIFR